jgi:AsmA protein
MRLRRLILIGIGVIVILPVAAILIVVARFNPNRYKPQIITAMEKATHRSVTITGSLHMGVSLTPTIRASAITIANPAGFADPTLLSLPRLQARLSLLPLLHGTVDIVSLRLIDPVVTLERNQAGIGDWVFAPPPPGGARAATGAADHAVTARLMKIGLQSVSITNATIIIQHRPVALGTTAPKAVAPETFKISKFTGQAASLNTPLHVTMIAALNSQNLTLAGQIGPLARLLNAAPGGDARPWPVDLTLHAAGGQVSVQGSMTHPLHGAGLSLKINGLLPNLAALDAYWPGANLPPAQNLSLAATIGLSQPGALPSITDAQLAIGASDLTTWRPGLRLTSFTASMLSLDQPMTIGLAGTRSGQPVQLNGTIGPLGPVLSGMLAGSQSPGQNRAAPLKVDLHATIANATAAIQGAISQPRTLAGVDLALRVQTPDLAQLGTLIGVGLPKLTHFAAAATLTDPNRQGLRHAIALDQVAISADQAQIGGAATIDFGAIPDIQALINAPRINLTALRAAWPKPALSAKSTPAAREPAPGATPPASATLIPDTALPFGLLHRANFNVELSIGHLTNGKADYQAIVLHAMLNQGQLTIRPLDAQLPGGAVSAQLNVNANAAPPQLAFSAQAPAFRLQSLLGLLGVPGAGGSTGTAQLYATLSGSGETAHGIASRLNGAIGVSAVNGSLDGTALSQAVTPMLASVGLSNAITQPGPVALRCFAARLNAHQGIAGLSALTLDSSRLALTGTGNLNLGSEQLNLVFLPTVRVGANPVPVAVGLSGAFAHPHFGLAPPGAYRGAAVALAQQFGANHGASILGNVTQALGLTSRPNPQGCRAALAQARMGHPGPAPAAAIPSAHQAAPNTTPRLLQGPQNLLNSLLK